MKNRLDYELGRDKKVKFNNIKTSSFIIPKKIEKNWDNKYLDIIKKLKLLGLFG